MNIPNQSNVYNTIWVWQKACSVEVKQVRKGNFAGACQSLPNIYIYISSVSYRCGWMRKKSVRRWWLCEHTRFLHMQVPGWISEHADEDRMPRWEYIPVGTPKRPSIFLAVSKVLNRSRFPLNLNCWELILAPWFARESQITCDKLFRPPTICVSELKNGDIVLSFFFSPNCSVLDREGEAWLMI